MTKVLSWRWGMALVVFDLLAAGFNVAIGLYWSHYPRLNYAMAAFVAFTGIGLLVSLVRLRKAQTELRVWLERTK